jgi:hypothetical protein
MRNAGMVVAVPLFVITLLAGVFNWQVCGPCVALLGGAAAGYLVNQWLRPETSGLAARRGAQAGALAGVGALLGHVVGGLLGAARLGPAAAAAQLAEIMRAMGQPPLPTDLNPTTFYLSAGLTSLCLGLFDIALTAAVGALAGMIAYQMLSRRGTSAPAR